MQATIAVNSIHVHMIVADRNGKVIGGHLKNGCKVYTTVEVMIPYKGVLKRFKDDETGFMELGVLNEVDNMIYEHLKDEILYDGTQIRPGWALKELGIKGSSLITWIGPMNVKDIVDYEDKGAEIKGERLAHFIVEHFDEQPANLRLCYHRQRILVMILQDELQKCDIITEREGDDLYIGPSKLTVSIATISSSSMKIHLGMNLTSKGTPAKIDTIGIFDYKKLEETDIIKIVKRVATRYMNEIGSIEEDITKTRVF